MPLWSSRYCSGKRRDGEPCGNPSRDGRGGLCGVHIAQAERRWAAQKAKERKERRQVAEHTRNGRLP